MASAGVGEDAVRVHYFTCCWPTDNPLWDVATYVCDFSFIRSNHWPTVSLLQILIIMILSKI